MICDSCIHNKVCYSVAECLNYIPGFTCDDYESQRPVGKWEVDEEWITPTDNMNDDYLTPTYTCPFCGSVEYTYFDYCHCGADLRKEERKNVSICKRV